MTDPRMTVQPPARPPPDTADMRAISRCVHNSGCFHAYGAGPCFDTLAQAQTYRDEFDKAGRDPVAHMILRRRYGQR